MGRPRSCDCGTCEKCKNREYMRRWYARKTPEQRRSMVQARDSEKVKAADRARYYRDREKRLARMRTWAEDNREKVRASQKRWREENREKISAHGKARRAMLKGLLERKPCEVCGAESVEMHHDDYSRPLDVRWLCSAHHGEHHRRFPPDVPF